MIVYASVPLEADVEKRFGFGRSPNFRDHFDDQHYANRAY